MAGALALVTDAPAPRADGDVLLDVQGVRALFPDNPTRWWITHNFAPEYKKTMGRRNYWWRSDAVRWINAQDGGPL